MEYLTAAAPWIGLALVVALLVLWKELSPMVPGMDGDDLGRSTLYSIAIAVLFAVVLAYYVLF